MATVTKTVPYEILLRFSEGAEHQKAPVGSFEGAQYIERVRFVDEETGTIVGTPKGEENDRAIPVPREKIVDYPGERIVSFIEGVDAMKARVREVEEAAQLAAQEAAGKLAERDAALAAANLRIDELSGLLQEALERSTAAEDRVDALAATNARVDELTAMLKEMQGIARPPHGG